LSGVPGSPPHPVVIEPILQPRSPKNGNFGGTSQRLSPDSDHVRRNREHRDRTLNAKARHWRALVRVSGTASLTAALPGWRRSADRARLHANSLLTGNFTGNFAILRLSRPIWSRGTAVLQRLFAQSPTQINRENISENREFLSHNREFLSNVSGFLTALSQRRRNRVAMSASPPKADIHRHDGNVRLVPIPEVAGCGWLQTKSRPEATLASQVGWD
jgi:hypothetical protein